MRAALLCNLDGSCLFTELCRSIDRTQAWSSFDPKIRCSAHLVGQLEYFPNERPPPQIHLHHRSIIQQCHLYPSVVPLCTMKGRGTLVAFRA